MEKMFRIVQAMLFALYSDVSGYSFKGKIYMEDVILMMVHFLFESSYFYPQRL